MTSSSSVIGPQWMAVQAEDGQRRLDDPNDWVVAETAAALERQVPVIPVLVDGATMPARSELPPALASLASRQAMTIHHESFSSDVNRLIGAIERRLGTTVIPSDLPPSAPVPAVDPAVVQADYTAALAAFFAHRWAEAVDGFERVVRQQPEHGGARDRLVEARRHLQLETWNSQADHAAGEGRWADTVVLLENIRSLDPNYPDLTRRLQAATAKRRVADLQADIRNLAAAGQWAAVIAAGQELAAIDRSRADPEGLVSQAHARLAERAQRAQPYRPSRTPRPTPAPGASRPRRPWPHRRRPRWLGPPASPRGSPPRRRSASGPRPGWWPPWRSRSWSPSSSGSWSIQGGGRGTTTRAALGVHRTLDGTEWARGLQPTREHTSGQHAAAQRVPRPWTPASCGPTFRPTSGPPARSTPRPRVTTWRSSWSARCAAS